MFVCLSGGYVGCVFVCVEARFGGVWMVGQTQQKPNPGILNEPTE